MGPNDGAGGGERLPFLFQSSVRINVGPNPPTAREDDEDEDVSILRED